MAEAKSEQLLQNLNLLLEINSSLNRAVGLDEVLQNIVRGLVDILGYNGSMIFEYEKIREPLLTLKALAYNYDPAIIKKVEKLLGFSVLGHQFKPEEDRIFHRIYIEHLPVVTENISDLLSSLVRFRGLKKLAPVIARLVKAKAAAIVPMVAQKRVIGVFVVASFNEIKADELKLIRIFADQAAIAVERARLYENERRHASQLAVLRSVANSVSASLDLDDILAKAARLMVEHFNIDHCGILAFDTNYEMGRVLAEYPDRGIIGQTFPIKGYGAAERIIASPEPLFIEGTKTNPLMAAVRKDMERMDIRSMLILPLVIKGRTIGSIGLDSIGKQCTFLDEEIALAQAIADQVARTGEPIYVPDISRDKRYISVSWTQGSEMAVPLKIKERVIGVLNVETDKIDAYSEEDLCLLATFANQSSVALENARYYESIRLSEERFSHIAENIGDWVWEVDQEGRYTYCNSVVTSILGYTPEEMMGKPFYDYTINQDYEEVKKKGEQILKEGKTFKNMVSRKIHRQGNTVILKSSGTTLLDAGGAVIGYRGVSQDITRELELEEQLRQAQKLESLGTLAGGIAHDFNNILGGILGYASLIKEELPPGSDLLPEVETIITSAKRAAELTRQLLAFARKGHYQPVPVDLNNIVNEVVKLLSRTIDKAVAVETGLSPSLGAVMGDSGQINQMLLNLCLNVCDAMPAGGRLLIKTENIVIDNSGREALPELEMGSYVKLTVSDTGTGIEPEIRERIFDPFFTTKERAGGGKHSGLGLAMVFGIVKSHDGAVKLESEKGEGSAFFIYLPCTEKNAQRGREKEKRVPEGKETILVVDDKAVLCEVAGRMLETGGYRVILAYGGKEALDIYSRQHQDIDLVILDIIMPDMNGKRVYERLKKINAKVKVLISSGYSKAGQAQAILADGAKGFIQKPYERADMLYKVRDVLDAT
ncbi:Sensor histidine kinase RcsC [subsurface metagenome]